MSSNEYNEKMLIQMNDLFDELIEDAYNFSKDIMLGINMMPFAIGFFVLVTVGYAYYMFIMTPNLIDNILNLGMVILLIYVIYILIMKYYELKKKYSTLFDIKEKLDKLEEL